jgi:uncharacterized membrane protein
MSLDDMPRGGEREWQAQGYLVAISFDEESKAGEMMRVLRGLQESGDIELTDAVALASNDEGKVHVVETVDGHVGASAGKGALWGVVVGALFAVPVVGLAVGAGAGAFAAKGADRGITKEFQKRVAERLQPGTSAVLLLGQATNREKALAAVAPLGGHVFQTDLPNDVLQELEQALAADAGA